MPTIPDYEAALRARRNQLQTVRNQVANQEFQRPVVQQRVLRQITPQGSRKLKVQIAKIRTGFDQSKQEALGEIDRALLEQEQLERDFEPLKAESIRAEAINDAINRGIRDKGFGDAFKSLSKQDQAFVRSKTREILRSAERRGFSQKVSELQASLPKGEKLVVDYKKLKVTGVGSAAFAQSLPADVYQAKIEALNNLNYSPASSNSPFVKLGSTNVLKGGDSLRSYPLASVRNFSAKVDAIPSKVTPKFLGIRPVNINLLGNLTRAEPGKRLQSFNTRNYTPVKIPFTAPVQQIPVKKRANYNRIKWF